MRVKCESRRQAILDVAEEVFSERGFDLASMSEITARVGGSKATLYNYFASKEELFLDVMHRFAEADIKNLFDGLNPADDMQTALQQFGTQFMDFISRPRMITALRVLYAESGRTDVGRRFYEIGPLKGVHMLSTYLEQCIALGKLRPVDTAVAAQQLIALLKSEITEPLLFNAMDSAVLPVIQKSVANAVDVFLRAYAQP